MTRRKDEKVQEKPNTPPAAKDVVIQRMERRLDELEAQLDELESEAMLDEAGEMTEIQELTWALIDGEPTESQIQRLEQLIIEDVEARKSYVQCMQMHADLAHFFAEKRAQDQGQPSPTRLGLPIDGFNPPHRSPTNR